jgi:hypothetical protein
LRPPPKARVHGEPFAEGIRQIAPRRAGTRNPKNGFDKERLSRPLQPGSPGFPDSSGAMRCHCASLNIDRIKAALQFSALNQISDDLGIVPSNTIVNRP